MTYALAISTIISPEYLSEFIGNQYGFEKKTACKVLKTGINHSYLIDTYTGEKFVFRIYFKNWRTKNEIEEELSLLHYLKDNGISVSIPIKDVNNNSIQTINGFEGERFGVLFSFAEGEIIRKPSEEICYNLGVTMAKIHKLTINKKIDRKNYNDETLVKWAFNLAKDNFSESSNEMNYFERASSRISSEFNNAASEKLRYGTVHLDMWYENMKIKNGTEITLFDFDNCGNGWLFFDIAYSLMLIYRNEPIKEVFEKKRTSFYKGYESITSISSEEKKLIPYGGLAIWLHYTGVHIERFNDFSNHFLSEEFLKYWIHTVNQWMEFNEIKI
jgi:Ser/Thr protein kinase RdoA (MazF antagonist)